MTTSRGYDELYRALEITELDIKKDKRFGKQMQNKRVYHNSIPSINFYFPLGHGHRQRERARVADGGWGSESVVVTRRYFDRLKRWNAFHKNRLQGPNPQRVRSRGHNQSTECPSRDIKVVGS